MHSLGLGTAQQDHGKTLHNWNWVILPRKHLKARFIPPGTFPLKKYFVKKHYDMRAIDYLVSSK